MIIDFWDKDAIIQRFMALYNLTSIQICNIIRRTRLNEGSDFVAVFCEESGIKLDSLDVTTELMFNGKIISTSIDQLCSLRQLGLVPVDVLLETDSPIRRHLERYDLQINPSKRELIYKGKRYFIPVYEKEFGRYEDCRWCSLGAEECQFADSQLDKVKLCPYLAAIDSLAIKLYSDNAEIELFLSATQDEMLRYSTVSDYPEILCTITKFVQEYFGDDLPIGSDWASAKQETLIITVPVSYEDMSYRNGYIDARDSYDANDLLWKYEKYCVNEYYSTHDLPKCFWDNIWLINVCIDRILYEAGTICAGIKHDITIPYCDLKIDAVNE